jgi:hypothetical protein
VETRSGALRGLEDADETCVWRGMAFAQPPVGARRWSARDAQGRSPAPDDVARRVGACPGIDVPFFFGRRELCGAMLRYAAQFARTGDPKPAQGDLPRWLPGSSAEGAAAAAGRR